MGWLKMSLFRHRLTNSVMKLPLFVSLLVISSVVVGNELGHKLKPGLGKPAPVQVMVISPDGSGLPGGSGSVAAGKILYNLKCATCHGEDGTQAGNQLVGGMGSLAGDRPLRTVGSFWPYATTLFDYIARSMPYNEQRTLSADEVYAVSAYVLKLNGILSDDAILNEKTLPKVKMPNREGFIELIK